MNWLTRTVRKLPRRNGQTMTEYALILAAVAAVVVSLYNTSGVIVQALVGTIDSSL